MRLLGFFSLLLPVACAYSTFPVISEVHLTTLIWIYEDHNLCEDGCNIAYKYFKGQMGEVAWFYKEVPGGSMLEALSGNPSGIGIAETWKKCPQANPDDDDRPVHLGNARATHPYRTPVQA
ncbi:hypothetical protein SNOG_13346 [Parastagonospora nodorum SN15]|uniref:Uncharacterized protein n=1 Tax=Phaeosphaeria nodorum (strain SN15 / ATCC MYA-4574 / FGSC 10173) TaxID=321614 RepID=Q0U4G8_PHANO|nr:hypothetical protein SNOG_13346 [Parastagonospora nodorum SN15]EAT79230.1 hypothetical protein SNOG_13346 [Parastagonospora nodorum SN15]